MGKVHFPWSFTFLIWLSMKSVGGFAVLMPTGHAAGFRSCAASAMFLCWRQAELCCCSSGTYQPVSGILSLRSLIAMGIWVWSLWNSAGNFPSGVCVVRITSAAEECRTKHAWGSAEGSLTWTRKRERKSARFILGKEQSSLLHCLRKRCCGYV